MNAGAERALTETLGSRITALAKDLEYAQAACRAILDNPNVSVDFHGLVYWAGVVERRRQDIKDAL